LPKGEVITAFAKEGVVGTFAEEEVNKGSKKVAYPQEIPLIWTAVRKPKI